MLSSCSLIYPLGSYSQHEADRLVGLVAHGTCTRNDGGVSRAASLSYGSDVVVFRFCCCLFVLARKHSATLHSLIRTHWATLPILSPIRTHWATLPILSLIRTHWATLPFIYSFVLTRRPHYPFIYSFVRTRPHYPFFHLLEF